MVENTQNIFITTRKQANGLYRSGGSNPPFSAKVKELAVRRVFIASTYNRDLNPRGRRALRKCDVITFLAVRKETGPGLGCRHN